MIGRSVTISSIKMNPETRKKTKRKRTPPKGRALLNQVISLTGIPSKTIRRELKSLLEQKNIDASQLTVDQLRSAVASYLREIMGGLLEKHPTKRTDNSH